MVHARWRARRRRPSHESTYVGPVVGILRLELATLDHGGQNTGVQQLCLLDDPVHHFLACDLALRLDEAHHGEVASYLNVLAQVQAVLGHLQTNLSLLRRLDARLVSTDAILVAQVDVGGSVYVSLQSPWQIMEATIEGDEAGPYLSYSRYTTR